MSEIYLYPEEFSVEPAYNSRLWPEIDATMESSLIARLSMSIEAQGQLDSAVCVVDPARPLPHVLVIGHRRRRAIAELNAQVNRTPPDLFMREGILRKLRVRIDSTGGDMLQKAIISNLYSKSYSPMEIAAAIYHLRRLKDWRGHAGTQRLSQYLGVDPSVINVHERFLGATAEIRSALHSGLVTPESAVDLLKSDESKRLEIINLAKKIETSTPTARRGINARPESNRIGMRLSRPSILKAISQLGAGIAPITKSRNDIAKLLYDLDRPEYGWHDGTIRAWARSMIEWIQGVEPTDNLMARFADMTANSDRGQWSKIDKREKEKIIKREQLEIAGKYKPKPYHLPRSDKGIRRGDKLFNPRYISKIHKGVIDL